MADEEVAAAQLGGSRLTLASPGQLLVQEAAGQGSRAAAAAGPAAIGAEAPGSARSAPGAGRTSSSGTGYTQRPQPGNGSAAGVQPQQQVQQVQQQYSYGAVAFSCTAPAQPAAVQLLMQHMATHSGLLQQRQVMDLEPDSSGLPCLAALRHARHVTVASSSTAAVQQVAANLAANSPLVVVERVKCRTLQWVDVVSAGSGAAARLVSERGRGYDVVLGCVPSFGAEQLVAWLAAAVQLLAGDGHAVVLLCCSSSAAAGLGHAVAEAGLVVDAGCGAEAEGCCVLVLRRKAASL